MEWTLEVFENHNSNEINVYQIKVLSYLTAMLRKLLDSDFTKVNTTFATLGSTRGYSTSSIIFFVFWSVDLIGDHFQGFVWNYPVSRKNSLVFL
ncbi:unnamed protein product, partial [Vitis vinifera]|uniref:Uncharacterized protein n=1 Tax=Vitis vinifera TaxID=29760 RepID=D7TIU3_VITVI